MARAEQVSGQVVAMLEKASHGLRQAQIAHELHLHPQAVARALVHLEDRGVYLQEDDSGRISLSQP